MFHFVIAFNEIQLEGYMVFGSNTDKLLTSFCLNDWTVDLGLINFFIG